MIEIVFMRWIICICACPGSPAHGLWNTAVTGGALTKAVFSHYGDPGTKLTITNSTFGINGAKMYLSKAMSTSGAPDEKPKHLKNAIAALEKSPADQNPLGREWEMNSSKFLRVRVTFGTAVNAICWVEWEE